MSLPDRPLPGTVCYVRNVAVATAPEKASNHRRVFQDAAIVGALTSVAKVAAAVKVIVTARYFGASDELDAFLIAFVLPGFFVDTVAGTFTPSLIPELIRARGQGRDAWLAQSALALVLGAMLPLTLALTVAGRWLLPLLGSSFSGVKLDLTNTLFVGMLVWLPLGACSATWRAVLNAQGRVALAAGAQMGTPLLTMLLLLFGGARWGVYVLSGAVMAGSFFEFALLAWAVRALGYPLRPRWPGWTRELLAVRAQYVPLLISGLIVAGCGLFDQAVAGSLGSGSVSALSYGTKFGAVLIAVGGTGMATAVLPEFSKLVSAQRWSALRRALRVHAGIAMLAMIPGVALLVWWTPELVRLVFQHGAFDSQDAAMVSGIQYFSLMQVPFAVCLMIAQRLATALSATPLILRAGAAAVIVNVAGDLLLPRWMGVRGIALASGSGVVVYLIVLAALLYAREPRLFRENA